MNLLLLDRSDLSSGDPRAERARVGGERLAHLRDVLGAGPGDEVAVGLLGGGLGRGVVETLDEHAAILRVELDGEPPEPVDIELVLALPRPPMLRRLLQSVTSMGIKRIVLLNTARVEKSYWSSRVLEPASIERHLRAGLEQARDTVLPEVTLERRFRPFCEDRLALALERRLGLVADPSFTTPCPSDVDAPATVLVGPEGGFVPFELDSLAAAGAKGVSLGERALRVETAVTALLGRLLPLGGTCDVP